MHEDDIPVWVALAASYVVMAYAVAKFIEMIVPNAQ